MTDNKRIFRGILIGILTASIGFGVGFGVHQVLNGLSPDEKKIIDEYRVLKDDWLYGNEDEYLKDIADKSIVDYADSKDPYLIYTSNEAGQGLATDGYGYGFTSRYYDGGLYLTRVMKNSPAYQSGLKDGDVIYAMTVEGKERFDFTTHSFDEINAALSSVADNTTKVTLSTKTRDHLLSRGTYSEDLISILQTPSASNNKTMSIKIHTYLGNPTTALQGALKDFESSIDTLVFDLRGNGGGYLDQAAAMAKLFVRKGTMIYQLRDRNNRLVREERQTSDPLFNIPHFKVIMDHHSASASETFVLALRAGCDTLTYGLKSYGKGIAQAFKQFNDGSVLRYTYAYVYGPEKENESLYDEALDEDDYLCIHSKGIIPDVTFAKDYYYLLSSVEYSRMAINEAGQNFFLNALNDIYPMEYPAQYSATYLFTDAIREYGQKMAIKYSTPELSVGFQADGSMLKRLNDIFNKDTYDAYLKYYNQLTTSVLGE